MIVNQRYKTRLFIQENNKCNSIRPLNITVPASFANLVNMSSSIRRHSWACEITGRKLYNGLCRSKSIDCFYQQSGTSSCDIESLKYIMYREKLTGK